MRIFKCVLTVVLTSLFVGSASSESLESFGWKKTVDDFEGTVTYTKEGHVGVAACKSFSVYGSVGLVSGEPETSPLLLRLSFYGSEDSFGREGKLKVKTDAGITDTDVKCDSEYNDGTWVGHCYITSINNVLARKLSTTKYSRLSLPSINIDLKLDGECSKMLSGINELTSDYLKAQQ
jgi:hypothetical protein